MIVFFDIDGVLNHEDMWKKNYTLDKACVERFCHIVRKLNARPVIISSWRNGFISSGNDNNADYIRNLENMLSAYDVKIYAKTETLKGRFRDDEIIRYLTLYGEESYIILDDDKNEYRKILPNTYITDSRAGLTQRDGKKIIKLCLAENSLLFWREKLKIRGGDCDDNIFNVKKHSNL